MREVDRLVAVGVSAASALTSQETWIHRRVESITFPFPSRPVYRRHVSVDSPFPRALIQLSTRSRTAKIRSRTDSMFLYLWCADGRHCLALISGMEGVARSHFLQAAKTLSSTRLLSVLLL